MPELRLATRGSDLARVQTEWVARKLRRTHPGLTVSIVVIESSGDRDRESPVVTLTEMGAFVRSLQYALLDGRVDAAVHSCKDLPTVSPEGITIAAFPQRANPFDVLVGRQLDDLDVGATVGTGSPRRRSQLAFIRPDLKFVELRGNVDTRIRKVRDGEVAAAVLAAAGVERLGLEHDIAQEFTLATMIPAPAQGSLAVETIAGTDAFERVVAIDDPHVRAVTEIERLLLSETGAGCRSALAAYAVVDNQGVTLHGFTDDDGGPRRVVVTGDSGSAAVATLIEELRL
ncbi:MAG: hydroxymethylbilane synthase [Actinobacteria bacterium]|nr:hydroxymethylbilane synthase [Actinomycetota bacterium]